MKPPLQELSYKVRLPSRGEVKALVRHQGFIPQMKVLFRPASIILLLALTCGVESAACDNSDWMANLDDRQTLATITIPGSHDSGARHNFFGLPDTARCQKLDIESQLKAGIRFLDVRCKLEDAQLQIYHGWANQHLSFDEVVQACVAFLKSHQKECIVMSIQREGGTTDGFAEAVANIINRDPNWWFTDKYIPTLHEARKRMILLRRYGSSDLGIEATDWPDDESFPIVSPVGSLWVQDEYVVWSNSYKWKAVKRFSRQAAHANDGNLYLNFASGSNRQLLYPRIKATAEFVNPRIDRFFATAPMGHYGTIIMDFVTPQVCSNIIRANVNLGPVQSNPGH